MSENLEHSFVTQLKENQNIIHKICRLYTDCGSHKDLFQEVTIQLWKAFPKFRGDSKYLGLSCSAEHGNHIIQKNKRSLSTVEYEGRQHFIKDVEYNGRGKLSLCTRLYIN
jgi:RNA polymerase sigma-70 factor (ECF subfamily)